MQQSAFLALSLALLPSAHSACDMCAVTNGAQGPLKADVVVDEKSGSTCQNMQDAAAAADDAACLSYGSMYAPTCCEYETPTCAFCGDGVALPDPDAPAADTGFSCWYMEETFNYQLDQGTAPDTCANYQKMAAKACCVPGACFAGDMTAQLESGETVRMDALKLGDRVLTADGSYSDIHLFAKRNPSLNANYNVIKTKAGELAISNGHYLLVNGKMAMAESVVVGDMLSSGEVVKVSREKRRGAFTPYTLKGNLVVNGHVVSSYTKKRLPGMLKGTLISPEMTHMVLAVRRLAYAIAPETMNALAEPCVKNCDVYSSSVKTVANIFPKAVGIAFYGLTFGYAGSL